MSEFVITEAAEVTPSWLSRVLRESGALRAGEVESVAAEVGGANWSSHARLTLSYTPDAKGTCPPQLFLKICAGANCVFGPSEVNYYTRDYLGSPGAPLPRCYDAAYRETPRAYHVLLEDLSASHVDGFQREPDLELGMAVADALARLHAAHWGRHALETLGTDVAGPDDFGRYFDWIERGLEPLLEHAGGALEPSGRAVLERVFGRHRAAMEQRVQHDRGLTLVHGDTNPGNLMLPMRPRGRAYVIDRQPFDWSLEGWLAASDLAILMVLHWETERRRELEHAVLRRYLETLASCGVEFTWEELFEDYRFSVAQCLEFAVEWCVLPEDRTRMRWLWERQLTRSLTAWADLGCEELFEG